MKARAASAESPFWLCARGHTEGEEEGVGESVCAYALHVVSRRSRRFPRLQLSLDIDKPTIFSPTEFLGGKIAVKRDYMGFCVAEEARNPAICMPC